MELLILDNSVAATPTSSGKGKVKGGLNNTKFEAFLTSYIMEKNLLSIVTAEREDWKFFIETFHAQDFCLIRPSGMPLDNSEYIDAMTNEKLSNLREELVAVESFKTTKCATVGIATYTVKEIFSYDDVPTEEIATFSIVVEKIGNGEKILVSHMHRCNGRPVCQQTRQRNGYPNREQGNKLKKKYLEVIRRFLKKKVRLR